MRPDLRIVPAAGTPVERAVGYDADTSRVVYGQRHTACPNCGLPTVAGEEITHYRRGWWHIKCARQHLASRPASAAWIALAEQVVRRPSAFKPREVKAITAALLDIVQPGYVIERRPS
ncbi:hypothetical protein QUV83_16190 [Cellulomonas cellasea]|uniref:hypothetical protein n=1 Tax=Cellulomonas cellasea TaxID=43670 RepID=UPI0025A42BDA|nr:hypothetical protein [Cellulomonas cellasea]MDM8086315.1 hypothetical protein [Cellulomonas cellasea]